MKKCEAGELPVSRELKAHCSEEVLTSHALVLKVDPTEDGGFHVRGQCVPPFVFESHGWLSPGWTVAAIWGNHKIRAFSNEAAATLTGAAVPQTRDNSGGQCAHSTDRSECHTAHPGRGHGNGQDADREVTRAVGVRAVRAGLTAAVVGFEEARVAGRAVGLHPGGGQLHGPLEILSTDLRLGPFVHELGLQKRMKNGSA